MAEQFVTSSSITRDNLIGGSFPLIVDSGTVLLGQNLVRGTLLGKVTKDTTVVIAAGANTGAGTCTVGSLGKQAKIGVYTLTAKTATLFSVVDPDGIALKDAPLEAYVSNQINFTLTVGSPAFIAGDSFTITVAVGSGKIIKSLLAAVDGSQEPFAIMVRDVDATSVDKKGEWYIAGEFNKEKVTFGTGHTVANTKDSLRNLGIYLVSVEKE